MPDGYLRSSRLDLAMILAIPALCFIFNVESLAQDPGKVPDREQTLSSAIAKAESETESSDPDYFRKRLETIVSAEDEEMPNDIESYVRYMPTQRANSQSGKVGIIESAVEYSYVFKLFDKLPMEFALDTKNISINNSTVVKLPAHLAALSLGIETTFPFFKFDKTYMRIGISPSFYAGSWNFRASNFRLPFQAFLIYQPNEKWTFVGGVAVFPEWEGPVLPVLGFIYQPNDRLTFNLVPKRPTISYMLNKKFTVFAEADASGGEYEVDKDNLKNVILQYDEFHVGTGITYSVNKFIESSISVGGIFNRTLEYRDSLGKVGIRNGLYTEFRVEISI